MKEKKIIIRADGNARIGAGHLMRCLTIADAVSEKNQVLFVCADEESAALARDRGYEACVLQTDYSIMESEIPAWEKLTATEVLGSCTDKVILVDSYYMTNTYLTYLRRLGRVVVLDDMVKTAWNADAVINYNVFADRKMYEALESPYDSRYFTGGEYIPIRKEFCREAAAYKLKSKAKHVLITTGGGDIENIAGQILQQIHSEDCDYHVVTGRFNPHYQMLLNMAKEYPNIHIYHDVKNMAELMGTCDLAVTAGGTTIYELSAVGVPFVCFSYAENQEKLTKYIGENKIAGYGGAFHQEPEETLEEIRMQIEALLADGKLRSRYQSGERKLVDGKGADRIVQILCSYLK